MAESHEIGVRQNSLRRALATFAERFATELWPLPLIAIVLGVGLGIGLPVIDRAIDRSLPELVADILFAGGVDSARAVLSAIAGSLITATSLTFSLTIVALQLASSQASPRVMRTFARDRMVHATLAVFVGTFAYALTVLRTVQDGTALTDPQVPRIAVTLASLLTLVSVVMLTFFLAHLSRQLRVETVMRQVNRETSATIGLVGSTENTGIHDASDVVRPSRVELSLAQGSGFIQGVDRSQLLTIAVRHDIVIEEEHAVGYNVIRDTPVARWWPSDTLRRPEADEIATIGREIAPAFSLNYERTASQDIGFGIRQLADIATRAVSPGVNDPTTAVHALGYLAAILAEFNDLPPQAVALVDDQDSLRVILCANEFASLMEAAVEQPRRYGVSDPDVAARLFQLIRELAYRTTEPDRRAIIRDQFERLLDSVASATYDDVERDRFTALAAQCEKALNGHWV